MKTMYPLLAAFAICATMPASANDNMDKGDKEAHMKRMGEHMFKKKDTNNDGYISKEEHDAAAQKMFRDADANSDGKISMDEMMAYKKKEHDEWKANADKDKTNPTKDSKPGSN